jgi:rod shape determining protein RodA
MKFQDLSPKRRLRFDFKILIPLLIISTIGIITLLSTIILPEGGFGDLEIVYKQVLFIIVGIIFYIILTFLDLSYLKHWQVILSIYIFTLLLLLITLLFGPTISNVRRWLVVGGIQIQPSEIAKVTVILLTAIILSKKDTFNEWILFLISFLFTLPFVVLIYLEPDASMSFLTLLIWFFVAFLGLSNPVRNTIILLVVSFVSGSFLLTAITSNPLWYLLIIPALVLSVFSLYSKITWKGMLVISIVISVLVGLSGSLVWTKGLQEYQKDRIEAFFNPTGTEQDIGFNVNQSRIAIGSGRIFGKGFGNGTQSKRQFLPEHQTDFIFASFAEEFGLVGSLFLISLYGFLIVTCFLIAMNGSHNQLLSLISLGVGIKLLFEVFINIGTNTGAIPATGIPLPLMSAGGSIAVMTFVCFGLIQNIYNSVKKDNSDRSTEIVDFFED